MPATVSLPAVVPRTRDAARFAWLTLAAFILVVLWGAVVRATGSGAGCGANWPLCNGQFFPHHPRLATLIEFTHRSTSGICTLLDLTLIAWTFAATPRRHRARTAVLWSFVLLLTEAAFGAVLVLRHYVENNISTGRIVMQSVHFTNTLLLMASLALVAWFLRTPNHIPGSTPQNCHPDPAIGDCHSERSEGPASQSPRNAATLAILSTILVGATGSLAALADTLFPSPNLRAALTADFAAHSPLLVRMRWMHPAAAAVAFLCVLLLTRTGTRAAQTVLALMLMQFVLGAADVLLLAPTWMQIIHLLGADLYWIALVLLAAQSLWPTAAAHAAQQKDAHVIPQAVA